MALRLLNKTPFFNSAYNVRGFHVSAVLQKLHQFILSDIGEGIKEVTVREWFVKEGDKVSQFDDICLVESDKASVNITSRYDGIIKNLHYQVGDLALVGKPIVDIDTLESDGQIATEPEEIPVTVKQDSNQVVNRPEYKKLATPAVRRLASEHNITLKDVLGSGKAGRVMKEDILNFINKTSKTCEKSASGEDKTILITGIKKVMVKTMTESKKIPSFGYFDEVNVSNLIECRKQIKNFAKEKNVTYLPFFIKAMSKCIEVYPEMNSITDGNCENIIVKHSHNIGLAIDTQNGLIVPNIKNVQNLSISEINNELNILSEKARNGKLLPSDISNGTISISNIGSIGGTYASPLINPPEVCILGIGKFRIIPAFNENDEIVKSHVCALSWTADHRVIDGATVARFSNLFKEYLENPYSFLLDN